MSHTVLPLRPKVASEQGAGSASVTTPTTLPHSAVTPQPRLEPLVVNNCISPHTIGAWPSQMGHGSTKWLLPSPSDQSAAIASLLKTEIQSHNITRDMLHATERKRLEAVQLCNQLTSDAQSWATAYQNSAAALVKCTEEYTRLSTENLEIKAEIQNLTSQVRFPSPINTTALT